MEETLPPTQCRPRTQSCDADPGKRRLMFFFPEDTLVISEKSSVDTQLLTPCHLTITADSGNPIPDLSLTPVLMRRNLIHTGDICT